MMLRDQLHEEEVLIQDVARQFSDDVLMPMVQDGFRNETFDKGVFKEMGSAGLLGSHIEGYGCAGASATAYGLIAREVERVDSAYRSTLSVQTSLVMHPINMFGNDEQKERFLPRLATGELVGCFGLTEPNAGSDPVGMITVAKQDGDDFILNGSKTWITNAPFADIAVVWAKCDEDGGKVRGFIVDHQLPVRRHCGCLGEVRGRWRQGPWFHRGSPTPRSPTLRLSGRSARKM